MPSIVNLEPETVVAALGYGESPETEAWDRIGRFAEEHGFEMWDATHRFFGFNNPDPTPGSPNYGYEQWITVPDDITVSDPLEVKRFAGGRFATLHLQGIEHIGDAWQQLVAWVEDQGMHIAPTEHNCLEELLTPLDRPPEEWEFDLYLGVTD